MKKFTFSQSTHGAARTDKNVFTQESPSFILPLGRSQEDPSISMFHTLGSMFKAFRWSHFSLLLLCSMFHVLCSYSFAQGNLQFNQVLSTNGATSTANTGYSAYNSIAYTVPTGKVWKLEYAFGMNTGWYVSVNNNVIYYNNNSGQYLERTNPIWLKGGDILKFSSIYGASNFYFSGIEFNVVP